MRTLFIIALFGLSSTLGSLAQGTVVFANGPATLLRLPGGEGIPAGSRFSIELMYAPDGTPDALFDSVAVRLGAPINPGGPGLFNGGTRTAPTPIAGGFALLQVRAWETAYGSSYAEAAVAPPQNNQYAFVGKSSTLRVDTGDPTTQGEPASLIVAGFQGFTVTQVPEPSIAMLTITGILGLAFLRARR